MVLALPGVIFSLIFTSPNYFLIDTKENFDEADLIIQTVRKRARTSDKICNYTIIQMLDIDDKYWSNWRNETFVTVTMILKVSITYICIYENLGLSVVAPPDLCHFDSFHNTFLAKQDDLS